MSLRDIRFLLKTHYSNSRALVVGINSYANASPLSYAVNDAKEFRDVLIGNLSFSEENITYLVDADATKANILRAYLRFAGADIGLDERIIVYFAGHGHTLTGIRGEVGYLVPFDADMDDISTLIKWDELTGNSEIVRAKHMLFVMDACYGGLALTRGLHAGSTRFLKDMMLRYSRQVLTAGKADEVVADAGGPLPEHSVFSGHLLEGLRGDAVSEDGVLTAAGLMSYVYGKVANDKNSFQTPHYGHFDGDGDLILIAPLVADLEKDVERDIDTLVVVPATEEEPSPETTERKIATAKQLLSNDASSIELHDFIMEEVRRFLVHTSEDYFANRGSFSDEELLDRVARYELATGDLSLLLACIAYWAKPAHSVLLQKALTRSTDRLESREGLLAWLNLRWYPAILELYASGIAAVQGARYDSLADIFYAQVPPSDSQRGDNSFVWVVGKAILELTRMDAFKRLPGHERHYAPMSEYLFKILQPSLDDVLFMGKDYERAFDEFEVLLGLSVADIYNLTSQHTWGPIGRFGWKQRHGDGPLSRVVREARSAGSDWLPIKGGLFGGKPERLEAIAQEYVESVSRLGWW
jgi:hypothetical protein